MLAVTQEQVEELAYGALKVICEEGPDADFFDVSLDRIIRLDEWGRADGKAVPLSNSPGSRDGARTTLNCFDEPHRLHLPRAKAAHETMVANLSKRVMEDPWGLYVGTAGELGEGSVAEGLHLEAEQIRDGLIDDPALAYFHRDAGKSNPRTGKPYDMGSLDERIEAVAEATGAVGEFGPGQFEDIAKQWDRPAADQSYLERVWLNRWTKSNQQAFDVATWEALRGDPIPDGALVTVGFDGARFRDSTGLVITDVATGRQRLFATWERPLDGDDWEVDASEVDAAVRDIHARYEVWKGYADPPHWIETVGEWAGHWPGQWEEWWTNRPKQMSYAVRAYVEAISAGAVTHEVGRDTADDGPEARFARHIAAAGRKDINLYDDEGRPPLAWGSEQTKSRFYRFQQTSRTNYAALIVRSQVQRMGLRSVTTGADPDPEGDQVAWQMVTGNDLDISFSDAARMAKRFGRSYMLTSSPEEDGELAVITAEDPRQMVVELDPVNPRKVRAAFKLFNDSTFGLDVAILWLPGEKHVAVRERKAAPQPRQLRSGGILGIADPVKVSFSAGTYDLRGEAPTDGAGDPYWSETYASQKIPVQELRNEEGVGEYELHIDVLDRLNHLNLILMVVTTMQAFRQRGIEQSTDPHVEQLEERDESGQIIDYNDLFEAGPDSLWLLPPGAKVWESGQVDLTGLLAAIKQCQLTLATATDTPMALFTPDAANQTAEGAQQQTVPLESKVEEFLRFASRVLAFNIALGFEYMGDDTRSDPSKVQVHFLPVQRYSLAEKGAASAQAVALPFETLLREVWQFSPPQIREALTQRSADMVLQQQQAILAAKLNPPTPPPPAAQGNGNQQPSD
jgi:hypothetical protein